MFLLACVLVAAMALPVWAADLTLTVVQSAAWEWELYGQLSNDTDNDGLASLVVDVQVVGTGDVAITSSTCGLPYGTHYWLSGGTQSRLVGFTEFRSDGSNGVDIRAGQKTTALGQVVLTDIGYSAGSTPGDETGLGLGPEVIDWSAPVLIASGTYSGLYGTLAVTVGAGQVNVLDEGRDPSQPGGVHQIETVLPDQGRIYCPGDANGNDRVDGGDLALMGGNWMVSSGMTWADADFNGDGAVNGGDLALMGGYWNWSAPTGPPAPAPLTLPEPATAALLSLGGIATLIRRRRSIS